MTPPPASGPVSLRPPAMTLLARDWSVAPRPLRRAGMLVLAFWWLSTGLIFALQRTESTRLVAMVAFSAAAVGALAILYQTRHARSPRSIGWAFLAGGTLWAWLTNALFGGWLVGPPGVRASTSERSLALAAEAVHATLYAEVAGVAILATVWLLLRGAPNRIGFATIVVLWATQQLAKLNIFLGVANPGTRFLPDRLRFLAEFFGPARTTPLLIASIVGLGWLAFRLGRRAVREREPADRFAAGLLAALMALAVVEHLVLGIRLDLPLWDLFLELRGS